MTLIEYRAHFRSQLNNIYVTDECDDFLKRIIFAYFGWESIKIGMEPNYKLTLAEKTKLDLAISALKKEKPLQYVLGTSFFLDLELEVNTSVLIPRPETEELVEWVLADQDKTSTLEVLDIGTGSGCIAIGLKQAIPRWEVSALDISEKALKIAQRNAQKNKASVCFCHEDIFNIKLWRKPLNIIVSNPPYVVPSEKKKMKLYTRIAQYFAIIS